MATSNPTVRVITRNTGTQAKVINEGVAVVINGYLGEHARRQAVAAAVIALATYDTAPLVSNAVNYNGFDIPMQDWPAGHTF